MKRSLNVISVLVAVSVVFGCVVAGLAQTRQIGGGYKVVATDDPGVVEAAEFAVSAQAEKQESTISLVTIDHAERQVVAGTKYRLCLTVKPADESDAEVETQNVRVVVFRSLKNEHSLTSWEEVDCSESH